MRERVATALRRGGTLLLTTAVGLAVAGPAAAVPVPDYEMPFTCGQEWTGSTRSHHSPSAYSADFNRVPDLGEPALAAAPGVVTTVTDLGRRSYGRYVVIDHGNGDTTLYAHLDKLWAVPGQRVDQGHVIGLVGSSGGSSGPHLHFEERLNGKVQRPFFHGVEFKMPRTQASQNCSDMPVAGDWNGDGVDEVAVYRRKAASKFRFAQTGAPAAVISYGLPTDQPVIGDWDGNGTADLGVRRQRGNRFWLRNADGTTQVVKFGAKPDLPVAGDWDGNGTSELGVWRAKRARFLLRQPDGSKVKVRIGDVDDLPVTGDWNGDRVTDVGVWDNNTASFVLRTVGPDGQPLLTTVPFGSPGDLPVAGDWNGDGISDVGVWRPSEGMFYQLVTPSSGRGTATMATRKFGRAR